MAAPRLLRLGPVAGPYLLDETGMGAEAGARLVGGQGRRRGAGNDGDGGLLNGLQDFGEEDERVISGQLHEQAVEARSEGGVAPVRGTRRRVSRPGVGEEARRSEPPPRRLAPAPGRPLGSPGG